MQTTRHHGDRLTYLLLHPAEVGLLHRLRPAVRAGRGGVLVVLDRAPTAVGAQLGIGWGPAETPGLLGPTVRWFGGLTAADVGELVDLVQHSRFGEIRGRLGDRALFPASAGSTAPGR